MALFAGWWERKGARKRNESDPVRIRRLGKQAGIKQLIGAEASVSHALLCFLVQRGIQVANMKVVVVFLAVVVCALANEQYTTKYDNIDLDQILKSDRLLQNYVNCLLDQGSCTPDGKELKKSLPDALENRCTKCSEKQKAGSEKVIRYLIEERPQIWERLSRKYDSTGEYTRKFRNEASKRGIAL